MSLFPVFLCLFSLVSSRILQAEITDKVFFDISIDEEPVGRIVFGLFGKLVPLATKNFKALCSGERGKTAEGLPLHYKGSLIHKIVPFYLIQGGDITRGDGSGGVSIYGHTFADEGFRLKHSAPGILSMANFGPHTNGSQFLISTVATSWLDSTNVIIGEVVEGMEIVQLIENEGTEDGHTLKRVEIVDSGLA